jgi:hypothetical protein
VKKEILTLLVLFVLVPALGTPAPAGLRLGSNRIQIRVDNSEAEAVLAVLDKRAAGQDPAEADWSAVFASRPYQRLKAREASMKRDFTDSEFRTFVLTGEAAGHGAELRRTLRAWTSLDLDSVAARILPYLPANATIRVTVYPVIKPLHNSFVWELDKDPAIFFYLDPSVSGPKFENTLAHELHHVGFASIEKELATSLAPLPRQARLAAEVMGAFGEGFAMLAAAGSPDVHPHAASRPEERARWDADMAKTDADIRTLDGFFAAIVRGELSEQQVNDRAMEFFGIQGPWYTVGYRMAAAVEKARGRAALLRCMEDPRRLLATWNEIAGTAPKWSAATLQAVRAEPVR